MCCNLCTGAVAGLCVFCIFGVVAAVDGIDPSGAILIDLLASTCGFVSVFGVVSVFAVTYLVESF